MKLNYLIIIVLLAAVNGCDKKLNCPPGALGDCDKEILNSNQNLERCECVCGYGNEPNGLIYKSPIDSISFCWWEKGLENSEDYEVYAFDHHYVRPDGFEERVLGAIEVYYDGKQLLDREDLPYQGRVIYLLRYLSLGMQNCDQPTNFVKQLPFYMKENNRETLFMDQYQFSDLNRFVNPHVICGEKYLTKGYMLRRDDGMDWHKLLYRIPEDVDFLAFRSNVQNDFVQPDTSFFIHMPLLFKKG